MTDVETSEQLLSQPVDPGGEAAATIRVDDHSPQGHRVAEGVYDASKITVLEGLEAVRKRPGMYIGSTGERGLHHLVYEIVDNSVDEALAGYCDTIEVTLLADGGVAVSDNGRGIPVEEHPTKLIPTVTLVLTELHAGGKFGDGGYKVSGGLHGVGASVVNALSTRLKVEVRRDGYLWTQEFHLGEPVTELVRGESREQTGTRVSFWPSAEIFETTEFSYETLSARFREMAFLNKGLTIKITDERPDRVDDAGNQHSETFLYTEGLRDYVAYLNKTKEPISPDHLGGDRVLGGEDVGRAGDAVDHLLQRVGAHLRQHDQHP